MSPASVATMEPSQHGLSSLGSVTTPRVPMSTRIKAWKDSHINLQQMSPIFRLPVEIRQLVFVLVLTETPIPHPLAVSHDFDIQHGHPALSEAELDQAATENRQKGWRARGLQGEPNVSETGEDWLRPDNTGPVRIYCDLLRTSRRIYLETCHLPPLQFQWTLHNDYAQKRSPPWETVFERTCRDQTDLKLFLMPPQSSQQARDCCNTIPHHALARIRRLRWFGRLHKLQCDLVRQAADSLIWKTDLQQQQQTSSLPPLRLFDQIHTLHLTLRHLDWYHPFTPWPPSINPFEPMPRCFDRRSMKTAMAMAMPQPQPQAQDPSLQTTRPQPDSLATALSLLPSLRTLTIDFETSEQHGRADMEGIVRWAVRGWKFAVLTNAPRVRVPDGWKFGVGVLPRVEFDHCSSGGAGGHVWDVPPTAEAGDGRAVGRAWLVPVGATDGEGMERVRRWSWRGLPYHWLKTCPACGLSGTEGCGDCAETKRMREEGLGPRLYVWTVTWEAVDDVEFNRLAAEVHRERGRPEPEPEPEPEVPTWAGSDKEEMERRAALKVYM